MELAICACAPMVVGIPLKIWNAIRIERKLEEQGTAAAGGAAGCAAAADQSALSVQHAELDCFAGAVAAGAGARDDCEAGEYSAGAAEGPRGLCAVSRRTGVHGRLSGYRGGAVWRRKLKVVKEIAEETLDVVVPSMLLQPLIENSIKHGLEPRISGGTMTLRSRIDEGS